MPCIESIDEPILSAPTFPIDKDSLAEKLTSMIAKYLFLAAPNDQFASVGRTALLKTVQRYIRHDEQMELVFPGFPFKSLSKRKVPGKLPDLGEELLLKRLESLARDIESCYSPGAVVRIVSDGVVYGEILGASDHDVYRYNEGLRKITIDCDLTHITFVRVVDLLDATCGLSFQVMSEEEYVTSIPAVRARFLEHEIPGYDLDASIREDLGIQRTYCGYLKFLEDDLEESDKMLDKDGHRLSRNERRKVRRIVARQMLTNGAKFSDLAARKFPHCIRLSVHLHSNAGPKYAFDMFPGLERPASPWHNAVMMKSDGTLTMAKYKSFDPSTFGVIYRNGRPYYLLEHSSGVLSGCEGMESLGVKQLNIPYARTAQRC